MEGNYSSHGKEKNHSYWVSLPPWAIKVHYYLICVSSMMCVLYVFDPLLPRYDINKDQTLSLMFFVPPSFFLEALIEQEDHSVFM